MEKMKEKWSLQTREGLLLILDETSVVDREVLRRSWETRQRDFLFSPTKHGFIPDAFFDVGAYWGLYSLEARKKGIVDVIAFEPDPANYAQLKAQLLLNNSEIHIKSFQMALTQGDAKKLPFNYSRNHPEGNRGGVGVPGTMTNGKIEVQPEHIYVDSSSMDTFTERSDETLLIKIDVEGHESSVLKGMSRTIQNNSVFLQIEIFPEFDDLDFGILADLNMRRVNNIDFDYYFTNMSEDLVQRLWFDKT